MSHRNKMHERPPLPGQGHMEDYSRAFFITAFPLVLMFLCTLWAMIGYPLTLMVAYFTDRVLKRASPT